MLGELQELYDKERQFPEKPENQPIPIKVSKDILDKTDDDFLYDYAEYVIQSGISLKDLNAIQRSLALSSEVLGIIGGDGFGNLVEFDLWALNGVIQGYREVGETILANILDLADSESYWREEKNDFAYYARINDERLAGDEKSYSDIEEYIEEGYKRIDEGWNKSLHDVRQSLYDYIVATDFVSDYQKEKLKIQFAKDEMANWDSWYDLLYGIQNSAKNTLVNYAKSHQNEYMILENN